MCCAHILCAHLYDGLQNEIGPYAEHMLSHTWTKPERRGLQEYGTYGDELPPSPAPADKSSSGAGLVAVAGWTAVLAGVMAACM